MITVGLAAPSIIGQSSSTATFSITRDQNLWGRVWPGDFNGDGIADLAATAPQQSIDFGPPTAIQVVLGDGRGGFGSPIVSTTDGVVTGVGDFNGDRRLDIIAILPGGQLAILPGNGNGTFANPRIVSPIDPDGFALSADLDGDGKRDLVIGTAVVLQGHGDFTFGDPVQINDRPGAADGIIVDVNGDGKKDIISANRDLAGIDVMINRGSLQFTHTVVGGVWPTDVTAADMNGDGKVDIVVSVSAGLGETVNTGRGSVGILFGRGDGTFTAPTLYDTQRGAWQVVVGDFTRDGIRDIATANRSSLFSDDFCDSRKTWDTVTVLPGRGDGTFGAARSFSLGDQRDITDERFKNRVVSLNTADLNGDGATDLIASYGAVLLNLPARPNVAPTVDAGPDATVNYFQAIVAATAQDADDDMLLWTWTDRFGAVVGRWPTLCDQELHAGRNVLTVTVDDQHGHVVSDSVTITLDSGPIEDGGQAVASAPVDDNWRHKDVGGVAVPGSVAYADGKFTVTASGADIWGTADEFQFAYQNEPLSFAGVDLVARVESVQAVHQWTKAGLMFRESLDPNSRHASLFVTPGKGIAFQYRDQTGQISTTVAGPLWTAPVWLRLSLRGDRANAYYKRNASDAWTKLGQHDFPVTAGRWFYSGLAVTSHADGVSAKAVFSNVTLAAPRFTTSIIGGGSGSIVRDNRLTTITNRGTDIWNSSDQFTFLSMPWDGDKSVQAFVEDVGNTHSWAKAGLMFRETLAANSPNVAIVVTPGKGISFQFRTAAGATSEFVTPDPGTAPVYLRLTRSGNTFTGEWSKAPERDGWTAVGSVTIAMPPEVQAGLAVTSHNAGATTTAHFSEFFFPL